jgi:hypothetical protein
VIVYTAFKQTSILLPPEIYIFERAVSIGEFRPRRK